MLVLEFIFRSTKSMAQKTENTFRRCAAGLRRGHAWSVAYRRGLTRGNATLWTSNSFHLVHCFYCQSHSFLFPVLYPPFSAVPSLRMWLSMWIACAFNASITLGYYNKIASIVLYRIVATFNVLVKKENICRFWGKKFIYHLPLTPAVNVQFL